MSVNYFLKLPKTLEWGNNVLIEMFLNLTMISRVVSSSSDRISSQHFADTSGRNLQEVVDFTTVAVK